MEECPYSKQCPFFSGQARGMANAAAWLRTQYCRGGFARCARHVVHETLGQKFVPADLLPNELVTAYQILSRADLFRGGVRKAI